jgi:hypothetical protein
MLAGLYSEEHADMDSGYGVKYEHVAIPPSILLSLSPWRGAEQHAELMRALPHTGGIGVLLRDRDGGEVSAGGDGHPIVKWRLSDYDRKHMRRGIEGAARITEAMGAQRIYTSHAKWLSYDPGRRGDVRSLMRDADACGWGPGRHSPPRSTSWDRRGSATRRRPLPAGRRARPGICATFSPRRIGIPDRLWRQSNGLDRGARSHERHGASGAPDGVVLATPPSPKEHVPATNRDRTVHHARIAQAESRVRIRRERSMPQIIVQGHTPDGTLGAVSLAERAVPTDQQNEHYLAQLIERVGWALIDAEQLESRTNSSLHNGPASARTHLGNGSGTLTPGLAKHRRGRTRRHAGRYRDEPGAGRGATGSA